MHSVTRFYALDVGLAVATTRRTATGTKSATFYALDVGLGVATKYYRFSTYASMFLCPWCRADRCYDNAAQLNGNPYGDEFLCP